MSSETPRESPEVPPENTMSPEVPDVEGEVKSSDNPVERREAGSDKEECLEPMSKRQRKKLLKQKQWEEQKDLRRYIQNFTEVGFVFHAGVTLAQMAKF
ncbi:hypothetical protein llap_16377 [Limosa lapponica baueri]|uniref:Uncharacterized protein n=1 Tax=Limosa lapponica baueri TaxID=1758121 RepID=A0A2I0THN5_LIMLA|nr:hypothetical protein llap_16377 [Limosa lapponica baueri]